MHARAIAAVVATAGTFAGHADCTIWQGSMPESEPAQSMYEGTLARNRHVLGEHETLGDGQYQWTSTARGWNRPVFRIRARVYSWGRSNAEALHEAIRRIPSIALFSLPQEVVLTMGPQEAGEFLAKVYWPWGGGNGEWVVKVTNPVFGDPELLWLVLTHEFAHVIDGMNQVTFRRDGDSRDLSDLTSTRDGWQRFWRDERDFVSVYAQQSNVENFAESFVAWTLAYSRSERSGCSAHDYMEWWAPGQLRWWDETAARTAASATGRMFQR